MDCLERIIAATDLSAPARHAAERAALVSRETRAALDLLHVAHMPPLERLRLLVGAAAPGMEGHVLHLAQQKLAQLSAALLQRYGVASDTEVVQGNLVDELTRRTQAAAAGLLVCGARGESVVRRLVLGTTAARILGAAAWPVLVVRAAPHEPYRRALVPVDFSPASPRAVRHARAVAPGAEIVLLHACDVPFEGHMRYAGVDAATIGHYRLVAEHEARLRMEALCAEAGLGPGEAVRVVLHGDPILRIVAQEGECDCDLVVVGKHGASLAEKLLLGSVTSHVLAESAGDVLVSV